MKKLALAIAASAAVLAVGGLSACAESYGGPHGGYYYGDNDVMVDAYYDDTYGPYTEGYWNDDDGFFYYSTGTDHHFTRDADHHFRRDTSTGSHSVRAHAHAPKPRS